MITHDMHLMLEYTNRAVVISEGSLICDDTPANVLCSEEITERAYLKKTSLFDLAVKCGIDSPAEFAQRFISFEREAADG
jgi:ABC-type hemin transport system ATPase subunit